MSNQYKVGDRVRVVHTDYPTKISVGEIKEVVWSNSAGVDLLSNNGVRCTFFNYEVESYIEPVSNNQMNIHNLKVGDKLGGDTINSVTEKGITFENNISFFEFSKINDYIASARPNNTFYLVRAAANKELIGYKLKDKKYEQAAKALCSGSVYWQESGKVTLGTKETVSIPALKEAGVLDLWFEPVYKDDEVVITISGNRKVVLVKDKATIEGVDSMSLLEVKYLYDVVNPQNKLGKHTLTIAQDAKVRVGCQEFTKQDINTVYNALKDIR